MCGVIGRILADKHAPAAIDVLEALWLLQHRGQSSCGIATVENDSSSATAPAVVRRIVGKGLASEVFKHADESRSEL
jgi:glutamine phosphoribosylpyrophosphate amidotransferase